jgi:hypothetical protein
LGLIAAFNARRPFSPQGREKSSRFRQEIINEKAIGLIFLRLLCV